MFIVFKFYHIGKPIATFFDTVLWLYITFSFSKCFHKKVKSNCFPERATLSYVLTLGIKEVKIKNKIKIILKCFKVCLTVSGKHDIITGSSFHSSIHAVYSHNTS